MAVSRSLISCYVFIQSSSMHGGCCYVKRVAHSAVQNALVQKMFFELLKNLWKVKNILRIFLSKCGHC